MNFEMSKNSILRVFQIFLLGFFFLGCKKYPDVPELSSPAYLRVYNDIPFIIDAGHNGQIEPFFTFIMDPAFDANGVPTGGSVVGDYLTTREIFSTSYPINSGNSSKSGDSTYSKNYDYPGNQHVLTAPPINGFDLSAWAQVPSGKHRVLFISRPLTDTPFASLPANTRQRVTIDDTINLTKNEVYTLEAVTLDQVAPKYGTYLRQEDFIHKRFDSDKLYAAFFDLSGKYDKAKSLVHGSTSVYYYPDTITINYTYYAYSDKGFTVGNGGLQPVTGYNNLSYGTLNQHFAPAAPYISFPVLPLPNFYDTRGKLRSYGSNVSSPGTLPYANFSLTASPQYSADNQGQTQVSTAAYADPSLVNKVYDAQGSLYRGIPSYLANFNYVYSSSSSVSVLTTVNILEIVYDQIYQIQVVKRPL